VVLLPRLAPRLLLGGRLLMPLTLQYARHDVPWQQVGQCSLRVAHLHQVGGVAAKQV
jgi:hypothetical protein